MEIIASMIMTWDFSLYIQSNKNVDIKTKKCRYKNIDIKTKIIN
jgi:hypothetical protein